MPTEVLQNTAARTVASHVGHEFSDVLPSYQPTAVRMRQYAEAIGLPLMCVDAETGMVLAKTSNDLLTSLPVVVLKKLMFVECASVFELPSGMVYFFVPLPDYDGAKTLGVGHVFSRPGIRPDSAVLAAAEQNWSRTQLDAWLIKQPHCQPGILQSLLDVAVHSVDSDHQAQILLEDVEQLSDEIEHTYEEINLLHSLTRHLQISRSPVDLANLCLDRLESLIEVDGNLIWLQGNHGKGHYLTSGSIPVNELRLAQLISRFESHDWSIPLVKNNLTGSLLGNDFPGLKNFVMVSIAEGGHRSGWIFSCNLSGNREFGSIEASLLNSIATILGTHLRNIDLYEQHDELLLSFVRSLVSTLDAKDPYTRGHSERVALIARRIGQELNLDDDDLNDLYLSGLVHDIGKIGVNDQILQKPGQLTDDEFRLIQEHPMIGYNILSGLKNLQKVLPGVRNHHENFNGKGYPDGLAGDDIPFMARILAVADSYDAMGSDRPYRKGMPLESIEKIFQRGSGEQWDSRVIDAYFRVRDHIRQICAEYTLSSGNLLTESLEESEFDEA